MWVPGCYWVPRLLFKVQGHRSGVQNTGCGLLPYCSAIIIINQYNVYHFSYILLPRDPSIPFLLCCPLEVTCYASKAARLSS